MVVKVIRPLSANALMLMKLCAVNPDQQVWEPRPQGRRLIEELKFDHNQSRRNDGIAHLNRKGRKCLPVFLAIRRLP